MCPSCPVCPALPASSRCPLCPSVSSLVQLCPAAPSLYTLYTDSPHVCTYGPRCGGCVDMWCASWLMCAQLCSSEQGTVTTPVVVGDARARVPLMGRHDLSGLAVAIEGKRGLSPEYPRSFEESALVSNPAALQGLRIRGFCTFCTLQPFRSSLPALTCGTHDSLGNFRVCWGCSTCKLRATYPCPDLRCLTEPLQRVSLVFSGEQDSRRGHQAPSP